MSFSSEWDQRYVENTHLSVWPWSDLVKLVMRHCGRLEGARVLELGCGAGANIPFFQSLGVEYYAVDGSPTIVRLLHERFPDLAPRIVTGDFTVELPFDLGFDLVVERGSLTCNSTGGIESALRLVRRALRPGGFLISVDWFSTAHSEYRRGEAGPDENTRTGYVDGPFAETGCVNFADDSRVRALLSRFELIFLEEKRLRRVVPEDDYLVASWNLVAKTSHGPEVAAG